MAYVEVSSCLPRTSFISRMFIVARLIYPSIWLRLPLLPLFRISGRISLLILKLVSKTLNLLLTSLALISFDFVVFVYFNVVIVRHDL